MRLNLNAQFVLN